MVGLGKQMVWDGRLSVSSRPCMECMVIVAFYAASLIQIGIKKSRCLDLVARSIWRCSRHLETDSEVPRSLVQSRARCYHATQVNLRRLVTNGEHKILKEIGKTLNRQKNYHVHTFFSASIILSILNV